MRPALVALFAAVLTSFLDAQQVSETLEVRLIEVDAVVTDRKGNPVGGLTAADFELFENGRAQAITNFAEYRESVDRLASASQRELAEAAETSQRMVAYSETHSGTPAGPVLLKLARALKISPDELIRLKAEERAGEPSSPQNLRLWRKLKRVEKFPAAHRRTVVHLIDALVEGEARKKHG